MKSPTTEQKAWSDGYECSRNRITELESKLAACEEARKKLHEEVIQLRQINNGLGTNVDMFRERAEAANIELKEGEKLAFGIILPDGKTIHTILLPGEKRLNWNAGMAGAKEQGGDMPDPPECALFNKYMPEEFKKEPYWSNTQHAGLSHCAWIQSFDDGGQYFYLKNDEFRARAVRRVITTQPL